MKLVKSLSLFAVTGYAFLSHVQTQVEGKLQLQSGSCSNQASKTIHKNQKGGTCYAYAAATTIRAALNRNGREEILEPKFEHRPLRKRMIRRFGKNGANTHEVLKHYSKRLGLKVDEIAWDEAEAAIDSREKRPVTYSYAPQQQQHKAYVNFFANKDNRKKVLEKSLIDAAKVDGKAPAGHAVVITAQGTTDGRNYWKCKNSWSKKFGDNSYFRFEKNAFDDCGRKPRYFDVYQKGEDRMKRTGRQREKDGSAFQYEETEPSDNNDEPDSENGVDSDSEQD